MCCEPTRGHLERPAFKVALMPPSCLKYVTELGTIFKELLGGYQMLLAVKTTSYFLNGEK